MPTSIPRGDIIYQQAQRPAWQANEDGPAPALPKAPARPPKRWGSTPPPNRDLQTTWTGPANPNRHRGQLKRSSDSVDQTNAKNTTTEVASQNRIPPPEICFLLSRENPHTASWTKKTSRARKYQETTKSNRPHASTRVLGEGPAWSCNLDIIPQAMNARLNNQKLIAVTNRIASKPNNQATYRLTRKTRNAA